MRSTLLLAIALLSLAGKGRGQGAGDTVAILEARAAFKMVSRSPDSALAIAERKLVQAQQSGDKRLAAFAHKAMGWAWMHMGSYDKCFPDLLLSAQLFRELHDPREEMSTDMNLALAYSNHSEFTNSAKYLLLADSLAQQLNDPKEKAEAKRQMGILYREQGQYRKAIPYFRESMEVYRNMHDTAGFFGAAGSLCIVYMKMSMPDSSLALCNECDSLIHAKQQFRYENGFLQERYGDAWFALAKYDKAMESYGNAFRFFTGEKRQADMAYEAMNLGKTFTRLKRYREAENYLLLSYRVNDSLKMINYTPDVATQLAELYKATGDWPRAYHWMEMHATLQDSLLLGEQNEKSAQLQAQYEADKKEKEITLLKKDQQLTLAIVGRQKVIRNAAVALVLLLILIGILIINRNRTLHRARQLIELEKMRNTIARDLHDDMGSALSSINIISKVALATNGEGEKVNEHLKKIHEHSGSILENMSDIVWTINPVNDTLEKIVFKMKEFASDIFDPLNIEYSFDLEGDFHDIKLELQTRKDLYLVFKEAVNNAAKYSRCTKVAIAITGANGQISVLVKDNGIGFCRDTIKTGNGLKNMEQRAGQIKGELRIVSAPGQGTAVSLQVRSHN